MRSISKSTEQSGRAAETKARILEAALNEFSSSGLAGARTDSIAKAAGVNKALLYYYYGSKENLYAAALEMIAGKTYERSMEAFQRKATPGEKIVRATLDHFDRILTQHEFQKLMQQEMIRLHEGEQGGLPVIVKRVFAPLQKQFELAVRDGIKSGELIDADWLQISLAALGANVFYFLSAPVWRLILPFEPLAPEALAKRRKALVEMMGQTIFKDRKYGAKIAATVLADTPMPKIAGFWRKNERAK